MTRRRPRQNRNLTAQVGKCFRRFGSGPRREAGHSQLPANRSSPATTSAIIPATALSLHNLITTRRVGKRITVIFSDRGQCPKLTAQGSLNRSNAEWRRSKRRLHPRSGAICSPAMRPEQPLRPCRRVQHSERIASVRPHQHQRVLALLYFGEGLLHIRRTLHVVTVDLLDHIATL